MDAQPEDLIHVEDFNSMEITIEMHNTTTDMPAREAPPIQLIELLERGMTLDVPTRSCAPGHNLMLKFKTLLPNRDPFEFNTTAKVESVRSTPFGGTDQIRISFLQFTEQDWEKFRGKFDSRQKEIEQFLKAARGL